VIPIIPFLLLQSQSVDPARVPDVAASVTAARVAPAARPVLDGRLDDPAWTVASPVGGLMQRDPQEGAPATERVDVRILYDAEALYIGARLFDSSPQAIIRRLDDGTPRPTATSFACSWTATTTVARRSSSSSTPPA